MTERAHLIGVERLDELESLAMALGLRANEAASFEMINLVHAYRHLSEHYLSERARLDYLAEFYGDNQRVPVLRSEIDEELATQRGRL